MKVNNKITPATIRTIAASLLGGLAVLLFVASMFTQPVVTKLQIHKPNVNRIERLFNNKLSDNERHASRFASEIAGKSAESIFNLGISFHKKHLEGSHVEMVVFRHDTLMFWSSNIDFTPDTVSAHIRILKKDSYYYFSQCIRLGEVRVVFLTSFYVEYPYQNKLLQNGFVGELSEINEYRVSQELAYGAIPVKVENTEQFYLVPIDPMQQESYSIYKPLLQWLSLLTFYACVFVLLGMSYFKRHPVLRYVAGLGILIGTRIAGLLLGFPQHSQTSLFGPDIFAQTAINPSLGDFLVNSIMTFIAVLLTYRTATVYRIRIKHSKGWLLAAAGATLVVWMLFTITDSNFVSLVMHSTLTLETYRIFSINIYSIIGYLAIAFWFGSCLLITYTWFRMFYRPLGYKLASITLLSTFVVFYTISFLLLGARITPLGAALSATTVLIFLLCTRYGNKKLSTTYLVALVVLISVYSVVLVTQRTEQKEESIRRVLAINLGSERDPLAELLMKQITPKLHSDALVRHYVRNIDTYNTQLYDHLRKKYFKGYLNKYEMRAIVCSPNSTLYTNGESTISCNDFFANLIRKHGSIIPASLFYNINIQNGIISYLGIVAYQQGNERSSLYIELDSRPSWEMLGYPELLIEGNNPQRKLYGYSYAKYNDNKLITQGGDYPFPLIYTGAKPNKGEYSSYNERNYNHIAYQANTNDTVVVSKPVVEVLNTTASFVYNLIFFLLTTLVMLKISRIPIKLITGRRSFKNRVKWAMGLLIVLSLLLVATVTIIYSVRGFEDRIHKNLSEKLMSVTQELYRDAALLANVEDNNEVLTDRLIDLSNIFYSDMNIYDTTGMLVITSRPEIFDKDLMGERMNSRAWNEMHYRNSPKFVGRERIGRANFHSAYVPIIGERNTAIAYLNLPYFTKEEELKKELYSIVIAVVNIYALLLLLAFIIAMFISSKITRPLELIRDRISKVNITRRNDLITYSGTDEVGELIGEYNRMVLELDRSAMELARNQRENAWREMARQVAHEIKNPLTPIKLSLQYLVKTKNEGFPDWDKRFDVFVKSLDEQINSLSKIASEFSAFAKLPQAKIEDINLIDIIGEVMTIFVGYSGSNINITFHNQTAGAPIIEADHEQLLRVLNNLMLNAIQSIGRANNGQISIHMTQPSQAWVRIEIIDNGTGISDSVLEKLFTPNFTTKSSGMGLGLAISRGIVETFGGSINAKNNITTGATFWVELPVKECRNVGM